MFAELRWSPSTGRLRPTHPRPCLSRRAHSRTAAGVTMTVSKPGGTVPPLTCASISQAASSSGGGGVDPPTGVAIFGFGSLVHTPGFDYTKKVEGYIVGWRRVFYQGSTDHRGVPGRPGRTVTLEECPAAVTYGAAFFLAGDAEEQQRTLQYLEWREKQYDLRLSLDVHCRHTHAPLVRGALVYVATPDRERNPNYLGWAPEQDIAHQIATSAGPSGPNCEYVFKLADAMREMGVVDEELFRLEALVRQRMEALQLGGAQPLLPHLPDAQHSLLEDDHWAAQYHRQQTEKQRRRAQQERQQQQAQR